VKNVYILLEHIKGFFVKDQKLFITCAYFFEDDSLEVCECKDPEIMDKKIIYLQSLLKKYYTFKILKDRAFAFQCFVSTDQIAKHGEPRE